MRRSEQPSSLDAIAQNYNQNLSDEALQYLDSRGIGRSLADTYLLGSVTEPEVGHETFRGFLSIPYITRAGVVSFKFRRLSTGRPKYLGLPGGRSWLYNSTALFEGTDSIAITEGEIDALILHSGAGLPAVGVPGVNAWKEHHPRVFAGFRRVLIVVDNDAPKLTENCKQCKSACQGHSPGRELAARVAKDLRDVAVVVHPPAGMDVNEWYLAEGAGAIRKALGV